MPKTTKHQVIVATWESLNRPSIGANDLGILQNALRDRFGAPNVIGPSAIARVLADEGAELRHPEIIEFDARWRQSLIEAKTRRFEPLSRLPVDDALTINQAEEVISELEKLRHEFEQSSETEALDQLRQYAAELYRRAQSLAKNRGCDAGTRQAQIEIAEWLKVWIQTPALFVDWLDLRRRSSGFQNKFPSEPTG